MFGDRFRGKPVFSSSERASDADGRQGGLNFFLVYYPWCGKSVYRLELRIGFQDTICFFLRKSMTPAVAAALTRMK